MFLVVFRNRKRAGVDRAAYDAEAARMEALAREQPGYRAFKSYAADDGEVVALSEWDDEATARAWGRLAAHVAAQDRGRERYYDEYTLFACDKPRIHRFRRGA
ncbi:MAG: antibiotic biosynthesis monooxygenase [Novosphingobium sp.]